MPNGKRVIVSRHYILLCECVFSERKYVHYTRARPAEIVRRAPCKGLSVFKQKNFCHVRLLE